MKKIKLTQGKFTKVDDEDYIKLKPFKWYYGGTSGGARTTVLKRKLLMHRLIMGAPKGKLIDHIDHDILNNQKYNLRLCDFSGNSKNRSSMKDSSSKYLGVSYFKERRKWRAHIHVKNKTVHLGIFINEKDAAKSYNVAAKKYHKEFANPNVII